MFYYNQTVNDNEKYKEESKNFSSILTEKSLKSRTLFIIKFIKPKVIMIGTGWVASAGITIYLAAEKENRYSLPNTRYMIHQPLGGFNGPATDIGIEAKEILRVRTRINNLISEATNQPIEKVNKDTDRNYWLTSTEALEYGLVNKIISKHSDLCD